jgi:hypothetical protein
MERQNTMNREQRRASKFKRNMRHGAASAAGSFAVGAGDRNEQRSNPHAAFNRVLLSQPYSQQDADRLDVEARLAWHKLTNGLGTTALFDELSCMINVGSRLADDVDELVQSVFDRAIESMKTMKARYTRTGAFGADSEALQNVPDALELLHQMYVHVSPLQAAQALRDSSAIMRRQMAMQPIGLSTEVRHA